MKRGWWGWNAPDPEPAGRTETTAPVLVSLHFVRIALRRSRRIWVGLTLLGLAAGLAWSLVLAPPSHARVTVLLVHDPSANPDVAMATDVSLLGTRVLAKEVIDELDLDISAEELQASVVAEPVTTSVLQITVAGPDDAAATERARVLADEFLLFRNGQIQSHSTTLVAEYRSQERRLRATMGSLDRRAAAAQRAGATEQSNEYLTARVQAENELNEVLRTMQDVQLRADSVVAATHVVDPASPLPASAAKRVLIGVVSGAGGGFTVGVGLVLLLAISSDRVRRREDVAQVLDTPVRISVGPLRWRPGSLLVSGRSLPGRSLDLAVGALEAGIEPREGRPERVVVAAVDNVQDVTRLVATLGVRLAAAGHRVCLVDASGAARLARTVARAAKGAGLDEAPPVIRPDGVSRLARGPVALAPGMRTALPKNDPRREAWDSADVALTLAEVDPALGTTNLATWGRRVVLVVSAGRSTIERLANTARMLDMVGQPAEAVVLLDADRFDQSLGEPGEDELEWRPKGEAVPS